jgi:flagellar hook-length control protein FliK
MREFSAKTEEADAVNSSSSELEKKSGAGEDGAAFMAALNLLAQAQAQPIAPVTRQLTGSLVAQGTQVKPEQAVNQNQAQPVTTAQLAAEAVAPVGAQVSGKSVSPLTAQAEKAEAAKQAMIQELLALGQSPTQAISASSINGRLANLLNSDATSGQARIANSPNTVTAQAGLKPENVGQISLADMNSIIPQVGRGEAAKVKTIETSGDAGEMQLSMANSSSQGATLSTPVQGEMLMALNAQGAPQLVGKPAGKTTLTGADFLKMRNMVLASSAGGVEAHAGEPVVQMATMKIGGKQGEDGGEFASPNGQAEQARILESSAKQPDLANSDNQNAMSANLGARHLDGLATGQKSFELPSAVSSEGAAQVLGHVTQGGAMKDRLTADSLVGLGMNIRNLAPQGGGEIRIKLQPENLGELHLRVLTDGNQVGLRIQATDDRARKILEDSLGSLKDSLASLQLNLKSVEFTVAQTGAAQGDFRDPSGQHSQHQNQQSASGQWNPSQQGFQGDSGSHARDGSAGQANGRFGAGLSSLGGRFSGASAGSAFGARARAAASSGRLDVMA